MSVLRAILELQGCLDAAVVRTGDPRVAEIADRFLPGTSANPRWYREVDAFTFPGDPRPDPDPGTALDEFVRTSEDRPPSPPQASRLMYALGAVIHLTKTAPPGVELPFQDPTADTETLFQVLSLTGQAAAGSGGSSAPAVLTTETLESTFTLFEVEFTGWQDWYSVAQQLASFGILTADAAAVPLCNASVISVGGLDAVVVDTEFTSTTVSLNAVKAVADPRNWHDNYPAFFCAMQYKGMRPDGWRRVLETVGVCAFPPPLGVRLRTMLKFHKHTVNGPNGYEARLDYDLSDPVPDPRGDGQITVDRGYINMWSPAMDPTKPPVVVRTRKVARIEGISPYAQKRFVCAFGYAYGAMEMLFGSANDPDALPNRVPWDDPPEQPDDPDYPPTGSAQGKTTPAPSENSAISIAISMTAQCAQDLSAKQFELADKWLGGTLTAADLVQYTGEVGARLASDPWKYLQAISRPKGESQ